MGRILISWLTTRSVRRKSGQQRKPAAILPSFPEVKQHLTEKLVCSQISSLSEKKETLRKMAIKANSHTLHSVLNEKKKILISPSAVTTS